MSAVVMVVGLAYATLVAGLCVAVWSGLHGMPRLAESAAGAAWTAAGLLVFGALLAWGSDLPALEWLATSVRVGALEGPVLSIILAAGLAIPLRGGSPGEPHWSDGLLHVPALILAGTALGCAVGTGGRAMSAEWITPMRFLLAVCAGFGARTLGQALRAVAAGMEGAEWSSELPYGLLTLVAGGGVLVNLWQRGMVWGGADPVLRAGVAGAWLAWSADWLARSGHPRLRVVLTSAAVVLLVLAAVRGG
ncbi:MAG: hypothetical protein ACOC7Y_01315 [Chloroflexota bacterium]